MIFFRFTNFHLTRDVYLRFFITFIAILYLAMTNIAIAVPHGLGVQHFLSYQHLAVLVVWFLAIVDEEADTVGVEVDI